MEARELRTGNIISISEKPQVVTQITSEPFRGITTRALDGHKGYNCSLGDSAIEPIPLTEEWLARFGWNDENKFEFFGFLGLLKERDDKFKICYCGSEALVVYNREIKYVHQLQNLYFALTGEELTIKETVAA